MTNAEKFKEVFPNVEVNESQKGFVVLHFKTKFNGYEYQESLAVWNSTWLADYQGEPTIPLQGLISREEALMALTGVNLPTDRDKLIALFDKRIKALVTVEAVPLSVIEDIKAEIWKSVKENIEKTSFNGSVFRCGLHEAVEIIDRKIAEVTNDN